VFDKIAEIGSDNLCVSIITAAELRYGCARKGSRRLLHQGEAILGGLDILPLDVPADVEYGGIRAELESAGRPIGLNEPLIVTQTDALGATLVGEFARVRGLSGENWLA
jgi:tRNA(fMet)-specific endonuclease VapC